MVLLSVVLLAFGTVGFMLIEGWSLIDGLYKTVITLATVGYGEMHQISERGLMFTVEALILPELLLYTSIA